MIQQLELQLLREGGPWPPTCAGSQQQLEAENAALRQALQQAQVQMQAQLQAQQQQVQAGPWHQTGGVGGQQLEELQAKLARLQAALELKEEQHARQLRALQQEHERLRVEQSIR